MEHWEKCLQRTYQAFTTGNHRGRRHAIWWIEQALERNLLHFNDLSPSAICAVMRTVGPYSTLGKHAQKFLKRHPDELKDLVNFERRDNLVAISGFWMDRDDERHWLGLQAVMGCYSSDLAEFVTRYYWCSEERGQQIVEDAVREAYYFWEPGRHTFECELLCQIREHASNLVNDEVDPAQMEDLNWLASTTPAERNFLRSTRILDPLARKILLQTTYAGMLPREIAMALLTGGRPWLAKTVEMQLREAWRQLFQVL